MKPSNSFPQRPSRPSRPSYPSTSGCSTGNCQDSCGCSSQKNPPVYIYYSSPSGCPRRN